MKTNRKVERVYNIFYSVSSAGRNNFYYWIKYIYYYMFYDILRARRTTNEFFFFFFCWRHIYFRLLYVCIYYESYMYIYIYIYDEIYDFFSPITNVLRDGISRLFFIHTYIHMTRVIRIVAKRKTFIRNREYRKRYKCIRLNLYDNFPKYKNSYIYI